MNQEKWYAAYTKSRAEKRVYKDLQEKGVQAYLPLIKTLRQWSDRKKKVELPLIPSYIFVKIKQQDFRNVLEIDGVVAFIKFERTLVSIPEQQMNAMMGMVEKGLDVEATAEHINKGDEVRIGSGPLRGTQGEVIDIAGKQKFLLRIDIGYTLILNLQGVELIKV